ncbi:MAG: hypothetical protein JJT99_09940 [Rhodobacteraceae bacterium]|nr:hypothetical protein [Paracoccaceae bacterium]
MKRFTIDPDNTRTATSADAEIKAFEAGEYAAKRRAFIRDWICDRMRSISVLGAGSLIFLPLLGASAAQAQQGFVEVTSIDGVSNAAFAPDGSLQLTMTNGQVVTVAAAEVTVLPNGALAISTAAAEMVAGVAAAAGGIAGVGAGTLAAGAAAAVAGVAAAATGGSDSAAPAPVVGGGGVAGAFNPQVLNAGGVAGIQGFQGFAPADSVVQITINDANGDPLTDGAGNPFVFQGVADVDGNYTVAVDMGALGLTDGEEYQFVVEAFENDGTDNPTGDALGSETVILAVDTTDPTLTIVTPIADNDEINIADSQSDLVITGTSTGAEDGALVEVTINGVTYSGAVTADAWSVTIPAAALQDLPDGAVTIDVEVFDLAGNSRTDSVNIDVDLTPPSIDIDTPLPFGDYLNDADSGMDQTITGTSTGANDRQVTLTVTDANGDSADFTGMTDAATGDWNIDLPQATLQALAEGDATLSATVTDAFGNPPAAPATADFIVDTIAPDIAVTAVTDDFLADIINADDLATGFTVSGTSNAEEGQLVTVMINVTDSTNTGAVQADGTWTVLIEPADVVGLVHDDTPNFTARVQDLAGNETTSAPLQATVNIVLPIVGVSEIGGDDFINIEEHGTTGITVEGFSNVEDGQDVEVTLTQGATEVTVTVQAAGGTFSAPFTPADLAPFTDGPVAATAEAAFLSGNSNTSAPRVGEVDLTPPTIAIDDPLAGDNIFTKFNEINGLDVTGTTNAEDWQIVTVTYNGVDYDSAPVAGGIWTATIPDTAFAGIDTGDTITGITARVNDQAGNPSDVADGPDLAVDVDGPTIDINPIAGDDIINIAESEDGAGVEISGTSSGADGQTVTVNILVGGATEFTATDTATGPTGAWSVTIPQGVGWLVNDETFTVTADVEDFQGVEAPQATRDFTTDFNNPTIDINAPPFGAFLNALDTESEQVISGTSGGANDREVTVTVTDDDGVVTELTTMTDAATGAWSVELGTALLQALAEGGATISATVTSAAGNPPVAPATDAFTVDTIPPTITLDEPAFLDAGAGDTFLNAAEAGIVQTISGTAPGAEAGQVVTLTITDSDDTVLTETPVVDGAENWTVDIDLSGLAEGAVTISATVSDEAGNPAETPATLGFTKDTIAPVVDITQVTDDFVADVINADDVATGFSVTGTTDASEEGRDVTVTITGVAGGTATGEVQPDGSWSVNMPGGLALADGDTPEFIASVTDAAGNTGDSPALTADVNVAAPTISFDTLAGDDILNIAESNEATLTVSGTTTGFADGDQITLGAPGIDDDIMVTVTGNAFSHEIARDDVFALIEDATGAAPVLDGAGNLVSAGAGTITFTASGTNDVGNTSVDHTAGLDLALTPPALDITDVTGAAGTGLGGVLNIEERGEIVEVSGTSDADGQTVTVTLTDGDGFTATATATVDVAGDGTWTAVFAAGDLNALPDGTTEISLVADVTDVNGNETVTDPTLFDTDFIAPVIAIDSIESNGDAIGAFLNIAERDAGVTLSGTTDAEDGQIVTVILSAPGMADITRDSGSITDGEWSVSFSDTDLDQLPDAETATWTATVSDAAGNPVETPPSVTATTAFTPPEVTIDSHAVDGLVTGTVTGLEGGDTFEVTVDKNGTVGTYTATVLAGDIWEAQIDFLGANNFDQLGRVLDPVTQADATVFDVANNSGSATQDVTIYRDPGLFLELTDLGADTIQITTFQTRESTFEQFLVLYDDAQLTYVSDDLGPIIRADGEMRAWDQVLVSLRDEYVSGGETFFTGSLADVTVINFFPAPPVPSPIEEPVVRLNFSFDSGTADELVAFTIVPLVANNTPTGNNGGGYEFWLGSSGADGPIEVGSIASVVRGRGGDDEIDLSAGGRNTVIFEADPADNGVDTILGFEAEPGAKLPDQIGFAGLDHGDLRGDGTDVEALAAGGALGANTGFVILTDALADLDVATLETAAAGLTGESGSDIIYMLATDGDNAALAQITFNAVDDASATIMASFTGLGDLSGMSADEILGFSTV